MNPIFFSNQNEFRLWLIDNHTLESELIVGYYKLNSQWSSMTWSESVDQALCFGWIDGRRNSIDDISYQIRFTPRKKSSIWSAVNIKKVEELTLKGLMYPAGLEIYQLRIEEKSKVYAFENEEMKLTTEYENLFKENTKAWTYFENLAPSYRKLSLAHIMTAKQESTRFKRLQEIISDCELGTNKWRDSKYKKK